MSSERHRVPKAPVVHMKPASEIRNDKDSKSNIFITVLLILGCLTILFPLYMTIVIALKSPSEMTNDVAGALSLPKSLALKILQRQCG